MDTRLNPRWNDPELVAEFAARETDHRLLAILDGTANPSSLRALDIGCAAGRNAVFMATRGCDVHATDLSQPMVAETRRRLATILGESEANTRVHVLPMTDLSPFGDASFDFVVALGIFQQASSIEEWNQAVAESARVLRAGGTMLVAHFGVGTDLTGEHGQPTGKPHLFIIRDGHPSVLFDAAEMDGAFASHGFLPIESTETVIRPHEGGGQRVTLNAHYSKGPLGTANRD